MERVNNLPTHLEINQLNHEIEVKDGYLVECNFVREGKNIFLEFVIQGVGVKRLVVPKETVLTGTPVYGKGVQFNLKEKEKVLMLSNTRKYNCFNGATKKNEQILDCSECTFHLGGFQ